MYPQEIARQKLESALQFCFCTPANGEREYTHDFPVDAVLITVWTGGERCSRIFTQGKYGSLLCVRKKRPRIFRSPARLNRCILWRSL